MEAACRNPLKSGLMSSPRTATRFKCGSANSRNPLKSGLMSSPSVRSIFLFPSTSSRNPLKSGLMSSPLTWWNSLGLSEKLSQSPQIGADVITLSGGRIV